MRIDEIIPYKRNARHNEKAIPAVAESIKEFGLRGTIGLESKSNPVIVFGHTRVAALKSLGWREIPDEKIEFCDDLDEEQIKAFRIADNKTGDIATYNKAMLREEIRNIKKLDMSRFNVDFKSKILPYGAERLKTDKAYNLELISRADCNASGFPELNAIDIAPKDMQGFNYALSSSKEQKQDKACHFFIDDYQFERLWVRPLHYLDTLKEYECVLTPDFSLYLDMSEQVMRWNRYRAQALGKIWQDRGLKVVPTLCWAQKDSFSYCFSGIPKNSTVATSTVGVVQSDSAKKIWFEGMKEAIKKLKPKRILLYGSNIGFDFGDIEVIYYKAGGFHGV